MLSRGAFLSWVTHRKTAREREKEGFGGEGACEDGGNGTTAHQISIFLSSLPLHAHTH